MAVASAETVHNINRNSCIDSWQGLQEAINAIPLGSTSFSPELLLCAGHVVEISQPIQVTERSVRIGCSSASTTKCTLRASDATETRLLEITGGVNDNGHPIHVVQLQNLRLEGGESYYYDNADNDSDKTNPHVHWSGGGAVYATGVNLVVEDCHFVHNVAAQRGGAMSVHDAGRPIVFLVTRTVFGRATTTTTNTDEEDQENLSLEDDCHSIYFQQDHGRSLADLNSEQDFLLVDTSSSSSSSSSRRQQQHQLVRMEHWDDPAKAAEALQAYQPSPGTVLCF